MRLQNVLVATDFSQAAEPVYRWAVAVARRFNSRITLINLPYHEEHHFGLVPDEA